MRLRHGVLVAEQRNEKELFIENKIRNEDSMIDSVIL